MHRNRHSFHTDVWAVCCLQGTVAVRAPRAATSDPRTSDPRLRAPHSAATWARYASLLTVASYQARAGVGCASPPERRSPPARRSWPTRAATGYRREVAVLICLLASSRSHSRRSHCARAPSTMLLTVAGRARLTRRSPTVRAAPMLRRAALRGSGLHSCMRKPPASGWVANQQRRELNPATLLRVYSWISTSTFVIPAAQCGHWPLPVCRT